MQPPIRAASILAVALPVSLSAVGGPTIAGPACPESAIAVPAGTVELDGVGALRVEPFCLDRTEVTVEAYARCVEDGGCVPAHDTVAGPDIPASHVPLWSRSCNGGRQGRERHPINCLDWRQARIYCESSGGRLPSEGEWLLAAAGGEDRRYPWGRRRPSARLLNGCDFLCLDRLRSFGLPHGTLHYGEDGWADTAPAGSFPAGAGRWGHLDLAGNVWEFTGSSWETSSTGPDPRVIVIRGGGWAQSDAERVRSRYRAGFLIEARGSAVGFRCAFDFRRVERAPGE